MPRDQLDLRGLSMTELADLNREVCQKIDVMKIEWGVNSNEFESLLADRRQIRARMEELKNDDGPCLGLQGSNPPPWRFGEKKEKTMRIIHLMLLHAIGGLLAINAVIIWPYRHDLLLLWQEGTRWLVLVSR